jgi:hypothetical protein
VSPADPGLRLGPVGAWLNPGYGDDARTALAIQAESLGYPAAWLGSGRAPVSEVVTESRRQRQGLLPRLPGRLLSSRCGH